MKILTFGGGEREERGFQTKMLISIIIGKHMRCFKFQQNRIINEEFHFFEGGGEEGPPGGKGAPIHKFLTKLLLVSI